MKSKLGSLALWSEDLSERHVKATKSKPYRGVENVFSIDDEEEEEMVCVVMVLLGCC